MRELAPAPRRLRLAALCIVAALALTSTADASVPMTDPRWLPWIGCWSPSGATEDAASVVSGVQRVCVAPVQGGEGVELVSIANGEIVSRMRMPASGERQPVDREGCTGWESAHWSADAERLYLRSELTCSGSITRRSSGIIAVVSPSDWVDVQVVSVGDQRSTRILRYRSAADSSTLAREISAAVRDRELARQAARLAAAATPTLEDVVEASRAVDSSVVEAWLLQRMPRFAVNGASLRRLADARVPAPVIDLVVALGSPERYGDRLATRGYTFVRIGPPRPATVAVATPRESVQPVEPWQGSASATVEGREFYGHLHRHYEGCGHSDMLYLGGIQFAPYGFLPYWLRGAYGFGYGAYGGYGHYPYDVYDPYRPAPNKPAPSRGPTRVIDLPDRRPTQPAPQPDPAPATPAGGRVVNGRGYTKPAQPDANRVGTTSAPTPRSESPAEAPTRTAVPRSSPPPAQAAGGSSRGRAAAPPQPKAASETKPVPTAEPRTAKRRPPGRS